ncbi:hypothetical protein A176_002577 [Myxococcus hansupus]|uniref:Uncharacterized protein n=1 Tax=Pseudomyxococcus hansupus TaxID=1297742 RepID=A0A0H4WWF3_9BACT|nr:hypothetical protein A176_002577 [Myxococcus hansupus]
MLVDRIGFAEGDVHSHVENKAREGGLERVLTHLNRVNSN